MRIGIDARFLAHPQRGGFKTYTENLIAALARVDQENEYILYLDRVPQSPATVPSCPNFSVRVVPGQLPLIGMLWREQVALARQIAQDQLDLFHSPNLTAPLKPACPLVVTIHDMIWRFPEKFSSGKVRSPKRKLMEWYYRWVTQFAAQHASAIITVSHAAKQSIVKHLKLDEQRIFVTHEAASAIFRPINEAKRIDAVRHKYNLPAEFILAIGSADPRKNIQTLVQAYALLAPALRAKHRLVIVWTHSFLAGELEHVIQTLRLNGQVQFLSSVSNEDLVLLYNAAALFAFPSRYEGFGLPLLEAMACGTPVIAANNSSIPEIVGDAAILFDAENAPAQAEAMTRGLSDAALRTRLIQQGIARAASFSWERCAGETLDVFRYARASVFQGASR
jgi:glycosyltransferase involved in cell wall biosynthesis